MAGTTTKTRKRTAVSVLTHPLAIQILVVANEGDISPTRFVEEHYRPKPKPGKEFENALSMTSYHFRALAKAGCIKVVDMIQRRGTFERIYQGVERANFSDEEWAEIPQNERRRISTVSLQGLIARIEDAMQAQVFDKRDNRWLAWTAAKLDERGWSETMAAIAANYAELEQIRQDAEARLKEAESPSIPTTFATLAFESPPLGT